MIVCLRQEVELTVLKIQILLNSWKLVQISSQNKIWLGFKTSCWENYWNILTKDSTLNQFTKTFLTQEKNMTFNFLVSGLWQIAESDGWCLNIKMTSNSLNTAKVAKDRRWRTERLTDTFPQLKAELKTTTLQMQTWDQRGKKKKKNKTWTPWHWTHCDSCRAVLSAPSFVLSILKK